jgi:hypothetical protein
LVYSHLSLITGIKQGQTRPIWRQLTNDYGPMTKDTLHA